MTQTPQESGGNANRLGLIRDQIGGRKPAGADSTSSTASAGSGPAVGVVDVPVVDATVHPQQELPTPGEVVSGKAPEDVAVMSDRRRHTLYFSSALNARVDKMYLQMAHDIFPLQIEKADFLEACFLYSLEHIDDIRSRVQQAASEM